MRKRMLENQFEKKKKTGRLIAPEQVNNFFPTPFCNPARQVLKLIRHRSTLNGKKKTKKRGNHFKYISFFKGQQLHLLIGFVAHAPSTGRQPLFGFLKSCQRSKLNDQSGGFIGFICYPWLGIKQSVRRQGEYRRPGERRVAHAAEEAPFQLVTKTLNALQSIKWKFVADRSL